MALGQPGGGGIRAPLLIRAVAYMSKYTYLQVSIRKALARVNMADQHIVVQHHALSMYRLAHLFVIYHAGTCVGGFNRVWAKPKNYSPHGHLHYCARRGG